MIDHKIKGVILEDIKHFDTRDHFKKKLDEFISKLSYSEKQNIFKRYTFCIIYDDLKQQGKSKSNINSVLNRKYNYHPQSIKRLCAFCK